MKENPLKANIIFLSDSRRTATNIPYRIKKSLLLHDKNLNIIFLSFNYSDICKLIKLTIKSTLEDEKIIIHSHHLKTLIINSIVKMSSKLFNKKKIFSCHTFHCELIRYSKFKLLIIYLSKFTIDEYSCVSNNLKSNLEFFFKKVIKFIPIGISKEEKELILRKSSLANKKKIFSSEKDKVIKITWLGRFAKVKNPLLLLKSLYCLHINTSLRVKVIFAGDGQLIPEFKKELSSFLKLNLKNIEVNYIGMQERDEVIKLISSTDLYVNTSSSESYCVSANEFLSNPFCKLIIPDIQNLKEIYSCERVDFYKVDSLKSLSDIISSNINNFFKTDINLYTNLYPKDFNNYTLEETAKQLYSSYKALIK